MTRSGSRLCRANVHVQNQNNFRILGSRTTSPRLPVVSTAHVLLNQFATKKFACSAALLFQLLGSFRLLCGTDTPEHHLPCGTGLYQ